MNFGRQGFSLRHLTSSTTVHVIFKHTTRKMQYGARQEPMIAGSAFRLLKAGISAISPNETFNQAVKSLINKYSN